MAVYNLTDDTVRLLNFLHRGGTYAYFWTLDEVETYWSKQTHRYEPVKRTHWFKAGRPTTPPSGDTQHMYFGVNPTGTAKEKWQRATNVDVVAINCLFAEFDAKDYGSKEAALRHILSLDPEPSVIIDSGGGYHCYWLLYEPFLITDENRSQVVGIQRRWVKRAGADDVKDLARVLRAPGTRNVKEKYAPHYPMVEFVKLDMECLYDLGELAAYVPEPPKPEPRRYDSAWSSGVSDRRARAYTEAAVRNICDRLSSSGTGTRHHNSISAGLAMGNLVGGGLISEGEALGELERAVSGFNDPISALKAALWGLEKGKNNPKQLEDRPLPSKGYDSHAIVRRGAPQDAYTVVRSKTAQAIG